MAEFATGDELKRSRPGQTQEKSNGVTGNAGLYRHPGSGETAIVQWDPLLGNTQAEAFLKVGFEFVREAKPEEVKNLLTASLQADADKSLIKSNEDDVKGILARLGAAEAELAKKREADNHVADEAELSQEHAKDAALEQTKARETQEPAGVNALDVPTEVKTPAKKGK